MNLKKECKRIYNTAFGETLIFDDLLFDRFFDNCKYYKVGLKVAAMLFLLPCEIMIDDIKYPAKYLYAAATDPCYQGQGIMTKLLESVCNENDGIIFLKPAQSSLQDFYLKRGFTPFYATINPQSKKRVVFGDDFAELAAFCDKEKSSYTLMYNCKSQFDLSNLYFVDTMG